MTYCDRADMFRTKTLARLRIDVTRATLLCLPRSTATTTEVFMTDAALRTQVVSVAYFYVVAHRPITEEWGYLLMDKIGHSFDETKRGYTIKKSDCVSELPPVVRAHPDFVGYPVVGEVPCWDPTWMYGRIHLFSYLLPRAHFFEAPLNLQYLLTLDTPEAVAKDATTYAYTASVLGHHDKEFWLACEEGLMKHRKRTCLLSHTGPITPAGILPLGNAPISVKNYMLREMELYSLQVTPQPPPPTESSRLEKLLDRAPPCMRGFKQEVLDIESIVPSYQDYYSQCDVLVHSSITTKDLMAHFQAKDKRSVDVFGQGFTKQLMRYRNQKGTATAKNCVGCATFIKQGLCPHGKASGDAKDIKKDKEIIRKCKNVCIGDLAKKGLRADLSTLSPSHYMHISIGY